MTGALNPDSFVPWIGRHASKLGLWHAVVAAGRTRIEVDVAGAPALIDMLAIGCSLGPIGVLVEAVDRAGHERVPPPSDRAAGAAS